ncbi:single-stranded DNA-binding protein [Amycolatopsis sp. FDAARGOS 1241]|uniref:single-stranded DNA-binding protein n=1 Tax=Amycolatopsis sp. FDAARGOS 1241 TaxID=2778070 RepID=UPI00194F652C|nr:single-stranded DNA-binding protein [Amycolatopsis sp. FDAARGOS 1241]QRP46957.1 single-stranded DNA-binding protein [Amycolatopsis sp. FDAARGOS 1241]
MAGLPEITMAGTLTADPEMRFTPAGAGVCSFTLAANDRRFDKESGEWRDAGATFLRCTVWRRQAENVADCRKGDRLLVTGELRQSEWDDKNTGEKRYGFDVQVREAALSMLFHPAKSARPDRTTGGGGADAWAFPAPHPGGSADAPPF